jgi:hypothetical protein
LVFEADQFMRYNCLSWFAMENVADAWNDITIEAAEFVLEQAEKRLQATIDRSKTGAYDCRDHIGPNRHRRKYKKEFRSRSACILRRSSGERAASLSKRFIRHGGAQPNGKGGVLLRGFGGGEVLKGMTVFLHKPTPALNRLQKNTCAEILTIFSLRDQQDLPEMFSTLHPLESIFNLPDRKLRIDDGPDLFLLNEIQRR